MSVKRSNFIEKINNIVCFVTSTQFTSQDKDILASSVINQ